MGGLSQDEASPLPGQVICLRWLLECGSVAQVSRGGGGRGGKRNNQGSLCADDPPCLIEGGRRARVRR